MAGVTSLLSGWDADRPEKTTPQNGVFALVIINMLFYAADHLLGLPFMRSLYLPLDDAHWYQYLTSMFCHASWMHLSGNLVFLYLFGKLIEEQEGALGIWVSYLVAGLGANLVSVLFLSGGYALGASGAVFGLFVVSVLIRLSWSLRRLLEVLILGQFVVMQILGEAKSMGQNDAIGHLAHVAGALTGAALVLALSRLRKKPALRARA
jgi:membrane associated rhomboid family serine protease